MILSLLVLFSFSEKPLERGSECRPCADDEFNIYKNCHKTGYILTHAKKGAIQECYPKLSKTYFEALKILFLLLISTINLLILIKLRKNHLLNKAYHQ